jgi:glycosyltransferase involved in cell wall biosynthesis
MNILVIDVAAEHSGALTVLNQFIDEFEADQENQYTVVLGKIKRKNTQNIRYINVEWVKKSWFHRFYFDQIYVRKLVRETKPEKVLSLQNGSVKAGHIPQDVFFHNALPICDIHFSFSQSKTLWLYQQVIGRIWKHGLKKAAHVIVQAEWIRQALGKKWHIDPEHIIVKRPVTSISQTDSNGQRKDALRLFYPANGEIYKNHERLFLALKAIWDKGGEIRPSLVLTLTEENLPQSYRAILESGRYPVSLSGLLSRNEMTEMYRQSTLIFPSYLETVGLPLMEARAMGSDILAADCEYAHEAIGEYGQVQYFPPLDAEQIQRTIEEYIVKWKKANEDSDR